MTFPWGIVSLLDSLTYSLSFMRSKTFTAKWHLYYFVYGKLDIIIYVKITLQASSFFS